MRCIHHFFLFEAEILQIIPTDDYLIQKWYKPFNRPFRMCQPRDILEQKMSIAKYNMERVNFSPDLIDAAAHTYFLTAEKKDFGDAERSRKKSSIPRGIAYRRYSSVNPPRRKPAPIIIRSQPIGFRSVRLAISAPSVV